MQTASWNSHGKLIAATLEQLGKQRFVQRLYDRDTRLWSNNPDVQATISNRLGWLGIADGMQRQLPAIRAAVKEIQKSRLSHALLLGMGGSGLFPEVCRNTFGSAPKHLKLTVLDTTDPSAVKAARAQCPLKKLLVIVASKSGGTAEISALSKYFHGEFKAAGLNFGNHCVVITDAATALEDQAKEWHARKLFVHRADSGSDVGGRFAALTYFGLVPAALIGVDVVKLLDRAQAQFKLCGPSTPVSQNPAVVLGAALGAFAMRGRNKMALLCSPELSSFGTWVEQLIAESLGKFGKGVAPICGEPLRLAQDYGDDHVFVELQLAGKKNKPLDNMVSQLIQAGEPVVRIQYQDLYDLGAEAVKWEIATAAAGHVMALNPYDEPNVKESKERTKILLAACSGQRVLPDEKPVCIDRNLALHGSVAQGAHSLEEAVGKLFKKAKNGDYVTLLSFLARTPAIDKQVRSLREAIIAASGRSTMLGFGPRYLHSTGQLYKGGFDGAVYLFLTGDDPVDLAIPGERFGFSVLKQAQALGDFQALQEKRRRVLRVHIKGNLQAGLKRMAAAIAAVRG